MTVSQIQQELKQQMDELSLSQQQKVLDFARSLKAAPRRGVKPETLRKFIGSIPLDDLELMKAAIEEGCERIEPDDA